jgi:uncharacterized protein YndB with AHSA1/START domain
VAERNPEPEWAREIVLTRAVDAPPDLVFEVWTNPKHVVQWWGPNGFTNTNLEMNVRPGGVWRFIMHGPDGTDYPNRIVYQEVDRPRRLVYLHDDDGTGEQKPFHVTTTFDEQDGGTLVTLRLLLESADEKRRVVDFGAIEGGRQTLARLGEYLKNL